MCRRNTCPPGAANSPDNRFHPAAREIFLLPLHLWSLSPGNRLYPSNPWEKYRASEFLCYICVTGFKVSLKYFIRDFIIECCQRFTVDIARFFFFESYIQFRYIFTYPFHCPVNDILSPIRGKNIHCRARFDFFELETQRYAVIRGLLSRTRHAFPTIG